MSSNVSFHFLKPNLIQRRAYPGRVDPGIFCVYCVLLLYIYQQTSCRPTTNRHPTDF